MLSLCFINLCLLTGQTPEEYIATLEIDTLINSGIKDNRINMAFANCDHASANIYTSRENFVNDLETDIMSRFDAISPNKINGFSQYRNFFNLYSVWFPAPIEFEPVPAYYQLTQAIIDKLFLPWSDDEHGWITMMYSLKGGGGGGAGRRDDLRRGDALIWGLDWQTVFHEFNHTMPGVGDEYTASGEWSNFACGENANQTPHLLKEDISWRNWIDDDTPIPTPYIEEYFDKIGAFEGTIAGYFGCHRPTAKNCYMGAGGFGEGFGQDMCSICLQRFVCRLYKYVDAIENKFPVDQTLTVTSNSTLNFSVDAIKPFPNTQKYEWFLNGKRIDEGSENINIQFGDCATYEVSFVLTDTTDFVRYDEKFKSLYPEPKQTHTWFVNNTDVTQHDFNAEIIKVNASCTGESDGSIEVIASGGTAPYTYILSDTEYTGKIENLQAGIYEIIIVDANACDIVKTIEIEQEEILDFEIITEFNSGVWTLYPRFFNEVMSTNLNYKWSNGETNESLIVTSIGFLELEINNDNGCSVKEEILLTTPCAQLEVSHDAKHPNKEEKGAIYLDIKYGNAPYQIRWFGVSGDDLTTDDPARAFSSSNDQFDIHKVRFLFDDIVTQEINFWAETFTGDNYAGFDFVVPQAINFYSITSNVDVKGRDAKDWLIEASNDLATWTVLDARLGENFEDRLEKQEFDFQNEEEFRYYRIRVVANNGDSWLAIQEMEFGQQSQKENKLAKNKTYQKNLGVGPYSFEVLDANNNLVTGVVLLEEKNLTIPFGIKIIQDGSFQVKVENPNPQYDYYWFADSKATILLHIGTDFQPLIAGNYFVRAADNSAESFGKEIKGFTVTMPDAPIVETLDSLFTIVNPIADVEYLWYSTAEGNSLLHTGTSYIAQTKGKYYVSARIPKVSQEATDPQNINGINLWADASDLDGDGIEDIGRENSSAYDWKFKVNGEWKPDNWFAYRVNYANGLGVVEFGTVWYQSVLNNPVNLQTVMIVYEENGFSRDGTAPFYGLKNLMGKNEDTSKLFFDGVDQAVLNGKTFINGEEVNPMFTENKYELKTLTVVLSDSRIINLFASDEYWEGKVAELITWDRKLTDEEVKEASEFMRKKWLSTADLDGARAEVRWVSSAYEIEEDIVICPGDNFHGLTESGIYVRELKTVDGLDSIVTSNLTVLTEEELTPIIDMDHNLLSTNFVAETYQWYLNGVLIPGANASEWFATEDGLYTLKVTNSIGCSGESELSHVFVTSTINKAADIGLEISPNPSASIIRITSDLNELLSVRILNSDGRVVMVDKTKEDIDIRELPSGVYLIELQNDDKTIRIIEKLIKI